MASHRPGHEQLIAMLDGETPQIEQKNDVMEDVDSVRSELATLDQAADADAEARALATQMCIECGDQPAALACQQCQDKFCDVCYRAQHKRGNRSRHTTQIIETAITSKPITTSSSTSEFTHDTKEDLSTDVHTYAQSDMSGEWFIERSRWIPLRLTMDERKAMRLLEATLNVSEYTDKIDIISARDKVKRIHEQLRDVCSILSGLVVANDYKLGQKLIADKEFKDNERFFQAMFEIGRRHKIRNPEKMRSAYGKLVYLLQDSVNPEVQELLEFSCVRPVRTVHELLSNCNALDLLRDERMKLATSEIKAGNKPRHVIDREIKLKERAINGLAADYANQNIDQETVKMCIYSVGDNHCYLRENRQPCDDMIEYLTTRFHPDRHNENSLAIVMGRSGARLTHSHATQYTYCLQSLTLWSAVAHNMYKLWCLAEADLLDPENSYRLRNTGQGLNRIQPAPRVYKAIHAIVHQCQAKLGSWVGSSVIHLGDTNVPNALMFIDKYNQVSRILNPIVITLRALDRLVMKPDLAHYIKHTYGDVEACRMVILTDFFRHAFDGSGADNFFDAGSCIDGRLTSAWHWCAQIEKKPYYPVFLLAGFAGFDGEW